MWCGFKKHPRALIIHKTASFTNMAVLEFSKNSNMQQHSSTKIQTT